MAHPALGSLVQAISRWSVPDARRPCIRARSNRFAHRPDIGTLPFNRDAAGLRQGIALVRSQVPQRSNGAIRETQFDLNAGQLNFTSTSYEWLVVSGARAKVKGTWSINDHGVCGFMLRQSTEPSVVAVGRTGSASRSSILAPVS